MARRGQKLTPAKAKALDSAVRKLEAREAKNAARQGSVGQRARAAAGQTPSVGRAVRDGWISGA